jgi:histidinol-phosphate aminotransferase
MVDFFQPIHGSTDAGPTPKYDFSSNANALGPNPIVLAAVQSADPTHYPDPFYTELQQALAEFHHVAPSQISVGAGASELIMRLTRWRRSTGAVLTLTPTFGEYARAARLAGLPIYEVQTTTEFCDRLADAKLAFLCIPNNPTGGIYSINFLTQVAQTAQQSGTIVVADLAYLALTQANIQIPPTFWQLYAPNKAHGMTGIRAGYLIATEDLNDFRHAAPSWVLSVHGGTFLRSAIQPESQKWVAETRQTLWQWREQLQLQIQELGLEQRWCQANFGLINVGNATAVTQSLRQQDIRVRDCTSFGLPEWIRISAQSKDAQRALINAMRSVIN